MQYIQQDLKITLGFLPHSLSCISKLILRLSFQSVMNYIVILEGSIESTDCFLKDGHFCNINSTNLGGVFSHSHVFFLHCIKVYYLYRLFTSLVRLNQYYFWGYYNWFSTLWFVCLLLVYGYNTICYSYILLFHWTYLRQTFRTL